MLNDTGNALDDNVTRQRMTEGNTLFLMGGTNGIVEAVSYTHLDVYKRQVEPCR